MVVATRIGESKTSPRNAATDSGNAHLESAHPPTTKSA